MSRFITTYFLLFITIIFSQELCLQKFTVENGLPQSSVSALYEDNYGFLWIGTQDGIARFDGHEFDYIKTNDGLPEGSVFDIFQSSQNLYYFCTTKGLATYSNNKVTNISKILGLENTDVRCVIEDNKQNIWIGTVGKGVIKISKDGKLSKFNTENGFFSNIVRKIYIDKKNQIWFLSGSAGLGISVYDGKTFKTINRNYGILSNEVFSIYEDDKENIYLGTSKGLSILYTNKNIENINLNVPILAITQNHSKLYLASWGMGLIIIDNNKIKSYTIKNGLLSNNLWTVIKSKRGDIWFGTENGGLHRFSAEQMYFYSTNSGLKSNATFSYLKKTNSLFFTSYAGLGKIENNNISYFTTENGLSTNETYSLNEYENKIYISTANNINILYNNTISQLYTETLRNTPVYHSIIYNKKLFALTPNGVYIFNNVKNNYIFHQHILNEIEVYYASEIDENIYFCTNNGLFCFNTLTNKIKNYTTANGLPSNTILMAAKTPNNKLFLATANGLSYFDGTQFINYTTEDGLSNNYCYSVLIHNNLLFIGTNNGLNICHLENNKIIKIKYLTQKDGLPSNEFNQSALYITEDNILIAGTVKGLLFFNLNYQPEIIKPTIFLKDIIINDKKTNFKDYIELPYKQGKLELSFTSFFFGSKVKYYYKIDGLNENWTATENPNITLQALPFGNYKLLIKAINSDGEKTDIIPILTIYVHPPFYLQLWFILTTMVFIIGLTYGIYQYKTYQVKKRNILLEALVKERTHQLELEKEKSEHLLLNILPETIVNELKVKGYAEPREFKSVSIMFTDFKGFTQISSGLTPAILVNELNDIFKNFDEIIEKYKIEKIKTIGDSYMVCAGVPIERDDHADVLIQCAIEMQKYLKERAKKSNINWQMRIGIHSGPIMAGVVGLKKFTYDIWGDTVNIASRMESSGVPGEINISESTYNLIKNKFNCIYRGKVEAKGKGLMDMYLVKI